MIEGNWPRVDRSLTAGGNQDLTDDPRGATDDSPEQVAAAASGLFAADASRADAARECDRAGGNVEHRVDADRVSGVSRRD